MTSGILEHLVSKAEAALVPVSVFLELTKQCNLKCRHCYQVKTPERAEMSTPVIISLLEELRNAGCLYLTISGGEPLMRQDFMDICRKAYSLNMALAIFTNGTMVNNNITEQLAGINVLGISISIYGAHPEIHDAVTGVAGSYDKSIAAVLLLKQNGLSVRFKFIMMQNNIGEYEAMIGLSETSGIPYDIDPVITPKDDGDMTPIKLRLQDDELTKIYRSQIQESGFRINNHEHACSFGRSHCAISAYGDVYPCIQLPVSAGSIVNTPFKKIWANSPYLKEIREFNAAKTQGCKNCVDAGYCRRCPGLAYLEEGDLYQPPREACRHTRIIKSILNRPACPSADSPINAAAISGSKSGRVDLNHRPLGPEPSALNQAEPRPVRNNY